MSDGKCTDGGNASDPAPDTLNQDKIRAEIEKLQAETLKLRRETLNAQRLGVTLVWSEPLKIIGAVILGAGGAIAAYTQFEVAEMKAKAATEQLKAANEARTAADAARSAALIDKTAAEEYSKKARLSASVAEAAKKTAETEAEKATNRLAESKLNLDRANRSLDVAAKDAREAASRRDKALADAKELELKVAALRKDLDSSQAQTSFVLSKLQQQTLEALNPRAAALATQLMMRAREKGIEARIISGYRSLEQQEELFKARRTNVRRSVHNTGLAFDMGIFENGTFQNSSPQYDALGELGKSLGLVWGGEWKPFADKPHFETQDAKDIVKQMTPPS